MLLPAALSARFLFLMNWCLCVLRTLLLVALFLTWTVVGGRRFPSSVAVVDGRRFRSTSGHLEFISVTIMNGTATIRTIGRRVEYVGNHENYRLRSGICCRVQTIFSVLSVEERNLLSSANRFFSVSMDAAVSACTFPRPSVVVKYD